MIYGMLLAVHLAICLLVWLGIQLHILDVHPYMVFVALLLPFWGAFLVLILHLRIFSFTLSILERYSSLV